MGYTVKSGCSKLMPLFKVGWICIEVRLSDDAVSSSATNVMAIPRYSSPSASRYTELNPGRGLKGGITSASPSLSGNASASSSSHASSCASSCGFVGPPVCCPTRGQVSNTLACTFLTTMSGQLVMAS